MHAFLQFQCQESSVPACQDKARRTCQRWGDKGQTGIKISFTDSREAWSNLYSENEGC